MFLLWFCGVNFSPFSRIEISESVKSRFDRFMILGSGFFDIISVVGTGVAGLKNEPVLLENYPGPLGFSDIFAN